MAPGTLLQVMVTDELLVCVTWTVLTGPSGSGGRGNGESHGGDSGGSDGGGLGDHPPEGYRTLKGDRDLMGEVVNGPDGGRSGGSDRGDCCSLSEAGARNLREKRV